MSKKFEGKNYYEILRVERSASKKEIREAYKEIARVYHPDSNFYGEIVEYEPSAEDLETFKIITEAYNVLVDAEKRANYDRSLPPELRGWDAKYKDQQTPEEIEARRERSKLQKFGQVDAQVEDTRGARGQAPMTSLHQKVQQAEGKDWKKGHKQILTKGRGFSIDDPEEEEPVSPVEEKQKLEAEQEEERGPGLERYASVLYLLLGLAIGLFVMLAGR